MDLTRTYLSSGRIFHNEEKKNFAVDYFVEANDVGVVEQLHDANFAGDHAKRLFIEPVLLDDLDSNLQVVRVGKRARKGVQGVC